MQMTRRKVNGEGTAEPPALDEATTWARTMIAQLCGPADLPLFASSEWCAAHGPTRLASALRAACAWAYERDPHRLAVEVEAELEAYRRDQEGDYDGWRAIARRVRATANEPTFAELQRRRSA